MTVYAINKLIRELDLSDQVLRELTTDLKSFLAKSDLSQSESEAIANRDFRGLLSMGVHPYLLMHLAKYLGVGQKEYVQRL